MANLRDISGQPFIRIWDGVAARTVEGRRMSFAVVELDPNVLVPEHRHPHEQMGLCLRGSVDFRIGSERRTLVPGGTWCIPPDEPHEVRAGPEGAELLDIFAPVREDWHDLPPETPRPPRWP